METVTAIVDENGVIMLFFWRTKPMLAGKDCGRKP